MHQTNEDSVSCTEHAKQTTKEEAKNRNKNRMLYAAALHQFNVYLGTSGVGSSK